MSVIYNFRNKLNLEFLPGVQGTWGIGDYEGAIKGSKSPLSITDITFIAYTFFSACFQPRVFLTRQGV